MKRFKRGIQPKKDREVKALPAQYSQDSLGLPLTEEGLGIELMGCEKDEGLRARIKEQLESLQQHAPSDSFIKIHLERVADGAIGWMKVGSLAGTFFAQAAGMTPLDVLQRIARKVRSEIRRWNHTRTVQRELQPGSV